MDGCSTFSLAPTKSQKRPSRGYGLLFSAASAILLAFPLVASAANPKSKPPCSPEFMAQLLTQANGPFNQRIVGKTIQTEDGQVWITGTETAMGQLDPKAAVVREKLRALTGESTDDVIVARAITGSLARLKVTKIANDLDMEGMLVAHVDEGNVESLHNPFSPEIKSLVTYFKSHVEQVLREHPDYYFIELKAGEYVDPETSEVKGIKWWLEDVRRGYKDVVEASGLRRRVTLESVFAEDARVKADWAVPALPDSPVQGAYTEASVLYRFGIKVGNNQIRLRISKNGDDESLPVRATTVALDPEDMSLLLEASQATSTIPLEQVHQMIMHSMMKYQKIDHLKIIKRVFSLLQFWDEIDDYNILRGTSFTQEQLSDDFLKILRDPQIMELGQLKAQAELLKTLEDHHVALADGKADAWVKEVRARYGIHYKRLDLIIETLAKRIDKALGDLLETLPHVSDYVKWVESKIPYSEGELTKGSVFLTLQPNAEFRAKLAEMVAKWRAKFPHLKFNNPQDAHMTVQFLGRMTDKGIQALKTTTSGTGEGWVFEGGGAHIMGRNSNLIAMVYDANPASAGAINLARAQASSFGARPEKRFRIYVPHITLAAFDPSSSASRAEAQLFLQEATSMLSSATMHGMDVWQRNETAADDEPVYRSYRP